MQKSPTKQNQSGDLSSSENLILLTKEKGAVFDFFLLTKNIFINIL